MRDKLSKKLPSRFAVIATLMIILFLIGLGAILYIALRDQTVIDQTNFVEGQPILHNRVMVFPENTTDVLNYSLVLWCEFDNSNIYQECTPLIKNIDGEQNK